MAVNSLILVFVMGLAILLGWLTRKAWRAGNPLVKWIGVVLGSLLVLIVSLVGVLGGSLYMLTSGRVRAFKKDSGSGKQNPLGDLKEGAFFGEMSILTGQPRMASVVALSRCELLELDRPALDGITKSHPHVWDVLREFAEKRAAQAR